MRDFDALAGRASKGLCWRVEPRRCQGAYSISNFWSRVTSGEL